MSSRTGGAKKTAKMNQLKIEICEICEIPNGLELYVA